MEEARCKNTNQMYEYLHPFFLKIILSISSNRKKLQFIIERKTFLVIFVENIIFRYLQLSGRRPEILYSIGPCKNRIGYFSRQMSTEWNLIKNISAIVYWADQCSPIWYFKSVIYHPTQQNTIGLLTKHVYHRYWWYLLNTVCLGFNSGHLTKWTKIIIQAIYLWGSQFANKPKMIKTRLITMWSQPNYFEVLCCCCCWFRCCFSC